MMVEVKRVGGRESRGVGAVCNFACHAQTLRRLSLVAFMTSDLARNVKGMHDQALGRSSPHRQHL